MRRSVAVIASSLIVLAGVAGPGARAVGQLQPGGLPPMLQMGALYGDAYTVASPPADQTPEQRAAWVLGERAALGRTPREWIAFADATEALALPSRVTPARGDAATITDAVSSIYRNLGLATPDRARIMRDAGALPDGVRAPFADLVKVVARAYTVQAPLGAAIAARVPGWTPKVPLVTIAERDLMSSLQTQIVAALNVFRARTAAHFAVTTPRAPEVAAAGGTDPPLFSDPEGLVVLGGTGNATYTRSGTIADPVLLVEPAGSDRYENSAGGACPVTLTTGGEWMRCNGLVLSVVADLGDDTTAPSDDEYHYNGVPSAVQGAGGPGGIGLLVDVGGNDSYYAKMTRGTAGPFQPIAYYFDGGAQGFGYAGNGALIDGVGDDVWRFDVYSTNGRSIWALGQGFGGAGGLGVASDGAGVDQWLSYGLGQTGGSGGFQGIYTDGAGFYGGVGIMTDTGLGDDIYYATVTAPSVDYYAQGFGAFGGVGIMYEDGGSDDYYTYERATGTGPFNPLLNCAYGTASYGGVGIMLDVAGDDVYYGQSVSTKQAWVMDNGFGGPGPAYGLFVDTGGNDRYEMVATGTAGSMALGRGLWHPLLENTFGTFVDVGGTDQYIPANGGGVNNGQWTFGVDRGA